MGTVQVGVSRGKIETLDGSQGPLELEPVRVAVAPARADAVLLAPVVTGTHGYWPKGYWPKGYWPEGLPLVHRATVGTLDGDLRILLDEGYTESETAAALEHLVSFFPFGRVFGGDWPDFNGPAPRWRWVVRTLLDRERWRLRAMGDAAGVPVGQVHERLMCAVRSEGSRFLAAAPDLHGGALIQAGRQTDGGKTAPTDRQRLQAEVFKRLKDAHPEWGYGTVAQRACAELKVNNITGESVRYTWTKIMGWKWERADRIR